MTARIRRRRAIALAIAAAVAVIPTSAFGAFSAQEINVTNVFSTGTVQLESQTPGACYSTGSGSGGTVSSNSAQCVGSPLPSGQLSASSPLSFSSMLTSIGTAAAQGAAFGQSSCGAAEVADSSASGDTGLVYGAVTYGTAFTSPVHASFTSTGLSLSGATGTYVGTVASVTTPLSFTAVAWVKTTSTSGGGLMGFSDAQPDVGSSRHDRMLWVEPSGVVSFGVQGTFGMLQVASTATVNNGAWHFVAATLTSNSLSLDVDGTLSSAVASSPTSYVGYWHLGWAGDNGWANPGTDQYLAGALFGVAVLPPLSSTNLTTLEDASSAAAYASTLASFSPSAEWLLSDTGTVPYAGAIPVLGSAKLCSQVLVDVQSTHGPSVVCVYPASSNPCPATPPSGALLSSLSTSTLAPPTAAAAVVLLVRMSLLNLSPAGVAGLHLLADIALTATAGSWSAGLSYPSPTLET